jgi:hypothetical protein
MARNVAAQGEHKTRNVVLIVTDGLRWQEVFLGPDRSLLNKKHGGVADTKTLNKDFLRETYAEGRAALLPFFWSVIAKQGQIYGNQTRGSVARVTNGLKFSYPGYNEMLAGAPDPRIDRNDFGPNPNITALEFLDKLPEFRGRVAAFAGWDVFSEIFNQKRSELYIQTGAQLNATLPLTPAQVVLAELFRTTTRQWDGDTFDSLVHAALKDFLLTHRPRVLFVGYGETDEWAHDGRYDLVLRSAHQFDRYVAELWEMMQAMPEYRDQTTFIITTDHGRGSGLKRWRDHGRKVKGAEDIWIAVIGPDTPALGERMQTAPVTQSQIAATVAALLGQDFRREVPNAAPPIAEVVGPARGTGKQP